MLMVFVLAQVAHSDFPAGVLCEVHQAHQIARTVFIENRNLVSKANIWKVILQFWTRYLKPLDPNSERILQWMSATGELILA